MRRTSKSSGPRTTESHVSNAPQFSTHKSWLNFNAVCTTPPLLETFSLDPLDTWGMGSSVQSGFMRLVFGWPFVSSRVSCCR